MKTIFYVLSVLVIGAAAYFSWDNSNKIQKEIDDFTTTRGTKRTVEGTIDKTETDLTNTQDSLEQAKTKRAELTQTKENEISKERQMQRSIEKYDTEIQEADVELAKFEEIKKKIDALLEGIDVPWEEIPSEIDKLKEKRKRLGDDHDNLVTLVGKLTKEVKDKRAENARQDTRLSDIRAKIARNSKVGAITSVNSTWGFVIVNLGANNSNVTSDSTLLVTRNGRRVARLTPNSVEANQTVCDLNARDVVAGVRIQRGDLVTLAEASTGTR